jgi:hypothetical protein
MVGVSLGNVEGWALEPEIGLLLVVDRVLALFLDLSTLQPSHEVERVEEVGHWRRENVEKHNPPSIVTESLFRPDFVSQIFSVDNPIDKHDDNRGVQELGL